jgi:hypothetical protein
MYDFLGKPQNVDSAFSILTGRGGAISSGFDNENLMYDL